MDSVTALALDRSQPRHYATTGSRFFSVSTVCMTMTGEQPYGTEADKQRGTDLHAIFSLAVASSVGRCEPPSVTQDYEGYYRSMLGWIDAAKPEPVHIEKPSVSPAKHLPFAGTPDLLAWIHRGGRKRLALIDLKTGGSARWHQVQVLAYSKLELYRIADALGLLYVHADGTPGNYVPVKPDPRDWAAFQAAVHLLIWRES